MSRLITLLKFQDIPSTVDKKGFYCNSPIPGKPLNIPCSKVAFENNIHIPCKWCPLNTSRKIAKFMENLSE